MALRMPIGRLGINTVYSSAALGARAVMQAAYLVLLSRSMGPGDYGLFAGSVAAAVLLAPLAGWGIPFLLAERIAKQPELQRSLWAGALVQTVITGSALAILVLLGVLAMHDRLGFGAMAMLVVAELVFAPVTQAASMLLLALGRGAAGALVVCLVPAGRLAAVGALLSSGHAMDPSTVAAMHVAGSVVGALSVLAIVRGVVGAARWRERPRMRDMLGSGTRYAFGLLFGAAYTEVDKVLLLQLASATVAGLYTAAFRVVAVLVLPVSALAANALPRLFAAAGTPEWRRVFRAVALASTAYAAAAVALAFFAAPWLPVVFGAEYTPSSDILWMLAPWCVLCAAHQVAATGLTSLGHQGERVAIEGAGLALVIAANVALIPAVGARGAVLALLATEAAIVVACAWRVSRALARQPRPQTR
jgi:O-antigen/teichoic acid export membrane protein